MKQQSVTRFHSIGRRHVLASGPRPTGRRRVGYRPQVTPTKPYLAGPRPLAFAHRGGASEAPENTIEAFAAAVALGFTHLETDVHVTSDGVLVAFHDPRLDRVTDRSGAIGDLPWSEVSSALVDGRGRISTLEDLLAAFPEARFNIDPKSDASVDPLADAIERTGSIDRVCVGAFSDKRIARLRSRLGPALCTGMGPKAITRLRLAAWGLPVGRPPGDCAQVPVRMGGITITDERFVARAHRWGIDVHVWTIDEPGEMRRLLDLGVDGIMTDRPAVLRSVYEERNLWP